MGSRYEEREEFQLPFHVDPSTNRPAPVTSAQKRSSSFASARTRSRDRAAQAAPQYAARVAPSEAQSSLVNLNRWSRSTASSSHTHMRSDSSNRRMSFAGAPSSYLESPPGMLQKTVASSSSQTKLDRTLGDSPSITLPPINTLPILQTSVSRGPLPPSDPTTPSPSTAQILSAAARSVEYFGRPWEDASLGPKELTHNKAPSTSKFTVLGPSPVLGSASGSAELSRTAEVQRPRSRGHSRHRSQSGNGSASTQNSSRGSKQLSQKAMLSKALQKANTAVLLDNAQNFEGAMQAYSEACNLLQQVMLRSSGDEERRKLEAIRNTYTLRIHELEKIAPHLHYEGKALPARPMSVGSRNSEPQSQLQDLEEGSTDTATVMRIVNDASHPLQPERSRPLTASQVPNRRESLRPSVVEYVTSKPRYPLETYQGRSFSRSPVKERTVETQIGLAPPMESVYMPPPLSPRRPASPVDHGSPGSNHRRKRSSDESASASKHINNKGHVRAASNESMSWLDTIDESGGSTASSVHSRTSSLGVRRKRIRAPSGATEAEFDAALDAAVEAAYDDGFEPIDSSESILYNFEEEDEVVANVRRRVQLAKERVRQSEREVAIQVAQDLERNRLAEQQSHVQTSFDDDYDANESEEEERMLEEMTRGYVMDDFEFGLQSKSALPRESDSSGFSGRTWNSSIGSNPTTAGTVLSTVTETYPMPQIPRMSLKAPSAPPPTQALPPAPNPAPPPSLNLTSQSVRSRRLSGQNAKQLKIETATTIPGGPASPLNQTSQIPQSRQPNTDALPQSRSATVSQQRSANAFPGRSPVLLSGRQASSPFPVPSPVDSDQLQAPVHAPASANDGESVSLPRSGSPTRAQSRSGLRKNFSSSSLKNMKNRNLSVSNVEDGSDASPITPLSSQYNGRDASSRLPAMPTLPTPIAAAFKERLNGAPSGGMYLFDSDIHSPDSPGSPTTLGIGAPIPLEPCPTEYLLRPFWLMRALYQTIAHPRGGYISTKLFVPRDVWRVKGVKIKNVEDKIANCDYLTAALLKLAQVDTFDADAVLEEMQSLEGVLEQVQAALSKKLGNEVGVQGSGGMFKDALGGTENENSNVSLKAGSVSSKSSTFSWRRLRSKNSGVNLSNGYSTKTVVDGPKEGLSMSTLPMTSTSIAKVRFAKRDISQVQFSGPHANYMSALARLFDAAQTIDQIARQVEDPGLRHADKTQVGLELCTRHAAEFFGFYICRFVLTDVGMLLDKFIKRGSEWVLV